MIYIYIYIYIYIIVALDGCLTQVQILDEVLAFHMPQTLLGKVSIHLFSL